MKVELPNSKSYGIGLDWIASRTAGQGFFSAKVLNINFFHQMLHPSTTASIYQIPMLTRSLIPMLRARFSENGAHLCSVKFYRLYVKNNSFY
jgi:hypothetical protein